MNPSCSVTNYTDLLMQCDEKGLIIGPDESIEDFQNRIALLLDEQQSLQQITYCFNKPPTILEQGAVWEEALNVVEKKIDISPSWAKVVCSDEHLSFLQPAATWIFPVNPPQDLFLYSFVQLRRSFSKKKFYWRLISVQEVLVHEFVHLGRLAFPFSCYEEIFAYSFSNAPWRRFWGPIAAFSCSIKLVFVFFLLSLASHMLAPFFSVFALSMALKCMALISLCKAALQLTLCQYRFKKCLHTCTKILGDKAFSFMYRLPATEIEMLAKMHTENISDYVMNLSQTSIRWKILAKKYFS